MPALKSNVLLALLYLVLLAAGMYTGWQAWSAYRNPTIIIEWSTASELDTAGFNVLRSEEPTGPFKQINSALVPASPDPLTGGSYQYKDTAVEAGKAYYYRLEDVEFGGNMTQSETREAVAERSGLIELALSSFVVLAAVWGLFGLVRSRPAARPVEARPDVS